MLQQEQTTRCHPPSRIVQELQSCNVQRRALHHQKTSQWVSTVWRVCTNEFYAPALQLHATIGDEAGNHNFVLALQAPGPRSLSHDGLDWYTAVTVGGFETSQECVSAHFETLCAEIPDNPSKDSCSSQVYLDSVTPVTPFLGIAFRLPLA